MPVSPRRCALLFGIAAVFASFCPEPARAADEAPGRRYALLVGVSDYKESAQLRALPAADNDATHLREVLINAGYKYEDITLLTCRGAKKPTGENIRAALKELTGKCKPEDTVVLAFAGHGLRFKSKEPCFCPYDTDINKADETLLPLFKVIEDLGSCKAKRKLILVDACQNDPFAETAEGAEKKKAIDVDGGIAVKLPEDSDIVALFSCTKGQYAREDARLRHGVFFHFLILGLAGEAADSDGTVTLDKLVPYVRKNVTDYVKKEFEEEQHPLQVGSSVQFSIAQLASATEAQKLMRQALIAAGKGDVEAARKAYTEVIEIDKKNAEAYYQRALLSIAQARELKTDKPKQAEKYDEAARDLDRAIRNKPDHVAAYLARAEVNYRQNSLESALRDYEAALEMDDHNGADVLAARANVYYWLEKPTKALTDADEAIKLNPECAQAYYVRGVIRLGANETEAGMADLDKAVAIDPHNLKYRDYRLSVLASAGDAERVEREQARLEQIATYVPRTDVYNQQYVLSQQVTVGDFYQTRGDTARADRIFQKANDRAQKVEGGLLRPNQKNDFADFMGRLQNRPGQAAGNNPDGKPLGKPLGGLLGPKVQNQGGGILGGNNGGKPILGGGNPGRDGGKPILGGNNPGIGGGKPIIGGGNPGGGKPIIGGGNPGGGGRPIIGGGRGKP